MSTPTTDRNDEQEGKQTADVRADIVDIIDAVLAEDLNFLQRVL